MARFFKFRKEAVDEGSGDYARMLAQAQKQGFSGDISIYDLGLDTEDSQSLIIEGEYDGEQCCVAVGYGMNRNNLAIRKIWYRHGDGKHMTN